MNDTTMTIVGNLVETPKLRRTRSGHSVANFRVASTPRRFDREKQQWVDSDTLYVTVTAWRALGENVAASLHKGQPVVVTGRYFQREYEKDEMLRTAYELEAIAVGHDLTRGVAQFERVFRPGPASVVDVDESGIPADRTAEYLGLAEDTDAVVDASLAEPGALPDPAGDPIVAEIDLRTGELRELAPSG